MENPTLTKATLAAGAEADAFTSSGGDLHLLHSGVYRIEPAIRWQEDATDTRWAAIGLSDDSNTRYAASVSREDSPILNPSVTRRFAAGTSLSVWVSQGATVDLNIAYVPA